MANQVHAYKDRDIKRAIKVARNAELPPGWAVEVDPKTGKIKVIAGDNVATDGEAAWEAETNKLTAAS